ncbi:MAG TPA: hypothetical protein VGI61_03875, partial [Parafilimonas sp.]
MRSFSFLKHNLHFAAFVFLFIIGFSCTKIDDNMQLNSSNISSATAGKSKPNIIIILIDDIGYEIPQYTGGQSYTTPIMNYLASN